MIYIIDDSDLSALLLQFNLMRNHNLESLSFRSIIEAVRHFQNAEPTLVITDQYFDSDHSIPTGTELGKMMMRHNIDVPRILVSANDNNLLDSQAKEAGFNMFLHKLDTNYIEKINQFILDHNLSSTLIITNRKTA